GADCSPVGRKTGAETAPAISIAGVDVITVPLCTAHQPCAQGDFSCCGSACELCATQCSPRKSAIESATISRANAHRVTRPVSASSLDVPAKRIQFTS